MPPWHLPLLGIWQHQHLSAAASVPRTAQGTDKETYMAGAHKQGGKEGKGWGSGELGAKLRRWKEGKPIRSREYQSCFTIPLTPGREMTVESLLIATGHKANPFFSLLSTRPKWHGNLIFVLCAPWYLTYRSLHFLSYLLKHNNCLLAACVGDKEHKNMSFPIKARKGVVTSKVLKWHLHLGDKQAHSIPGKGQDFFQDSKTWERKGCPLQGTLDITTGASEGSNARPGWWRVRVGKSHLLSGGRHLRACPWLVLSQAPEH